MSYNKPGCRMKTCEEIVFGISIDEHVLFKASLFLLCFLSLLLILISILIVWLRNIQCRIAGLTKNTCTLPLVISRKKAENFERKNSWKNLVSSAAYGPLNSDEDGPRSGLPQETSFNNSLAPGNDGKSIHGSNTHQESIASDKNDASNVQNVDDSSAAQDSTSNHSEQNIKGDKLKKDYMSLKGARDHTYAKPGADSSQVESEMGCDERQYGKALNEGKNDDAHENDNEYLVVIHSDKSSALSEGNGNEMHPHEDESLYLIPIESKLEENGHHKMESKDGTKSEGKRKATDVSKIDDRVSPLDGPEGDKCGYLSSQHVGKLTTFGHDAEFQQTQPGVSKDVDEDDSGYLIVQNVEDGAAAKAGTNIPVGQFQAGGISQSDGPVNPSHGDDNSYDYIQTKYCTEPVDNNDSKHQRNNLTGKGKPVTNSSAEDNHGYLTVVHEREVNSSKAQEHSTDQIYSIIPDSNNNNNAEVQSDSEIVYVNQNSIQNPDVEYSDDVPVYVNSEAQQQMAMCNDNPGVKYSDDVPIYANSEAQQQNAMCNDNPAFCNVDESPLYYNL